MAQASSSVIVCWLPDPRRTPLDVTDPDSTTIMLDPRLWICSDTRAWAPAPTATMVITAPTPMTMPSMVRALRSLLTRSARIAMRVVAHSVMASPPRSSPRASWRLFLVLLVVVRQAGEQLAGVDQIGLRLVLRHEPVAEAQDSPGVSGHVGLVRDDHD